MGKTDKFLLGIVTGVIALIALVFITVLRQPDPEYQTEETPENIVHNYLLALRQQDYERAYGYLSPSLRHYPPTLNQFIDDVESNSWAFRLDSEITLAVASAQAQKNQANITIRETRFYNGGLFDSSQSVSTFSIELNRENSIWKITDANRFWDRCWTNNC